MLGLEKPIVTYEDFIHAFPNITNKSKEFAKQLLPLHASPELAALVAALMTDGHIDWYKSDGRPRTRKIILYSSNKEECEWFLCLAKNIFGINGRVAAYKPNHNNWKKQPYRAVVWNAAIARILILAGVPAGNKTEKEFLVPAWVMNGSKEIKREFLRVFFTFEGSKPMGRLRSCSFQISLCMVKNDDFLSNAIHFLSQIKDLLNSFGVKTSKIWHHTKLKGFKPGNKVVHFSIMDQSSIINFYRNIGYFSKEKQKLLKEAVFEISKFGRIKATHVCAMISGLKNIFGTDKMLASEINKFTERKYSNRQMEHYRRNETALPLELLFALIKIKKEKTILNELPDNVHFLFELNSSALSFPQ